MTRTVLAATAAALALAGCNTVAANADTAAIEKQLRDNEARWNQAYAAHDAETVIRIYADDAALANPGAPLATGTANRRAAISEFVKDPAMKLDFAADRVQVAASGDLAYTRGHYTLTMTDPETRQPINGRGNYLTVWQKQSDGSWKAVEDFITPGPAPASQTEGG